MQKRADQPSMLYTVANFRSTRTRSLFVYGSLAILALCSSLFLAKDVDLRVYWYAANGFFSGTRSAYGPDSGLGYPMSYRYPPVTYLILYPLRLLPLRAAGFCWMMTAWIAAVGTLLLAIRIRGLRFSPNAILACCAFMLAYIVLAIRYGNVQPFVICAIFSALILSETYPKWSGILLAVAISFKVWPILFLPWLFHRPRFRAATYSILWLIALWVSPLLIFGKNWYWSLLKQWYTAMRNLGTNYSEFYFPGQSLRGLLLRYFTALSPPLNDFPSIHVFSLSPKTVVIAWGVISVIAYCFFTIYMLRSGTNTLWAWDGLAFVLYSLLEPYAVKSGLISLGPAVLTAACLYTLGARKLKQNPYISRANGFFLGACVLSFMGAVIQYRPWLRFLLAVGLDFWVEILLTAAFLIWIGRTSLPAALLDSTCATPGKVVNEMCDTRPDK